METPQTPQAESGVEVLTVEGVLEIEKQIRENQAARKRGDPAPHPDPTKEQIRAALNAVRRHRGALGAAKPAGKKGAGGKATVVTIDLEGL